MLLVVLFSTFLLCKGQSLETPKDETCDGFECGLPGDVCVLMRDTGRFCNDPPCPLKPHCTEKKISCEGKRCPQGQLCEVQLKEGSDKSATIVPTCMRPVPSVKCGPEEYYDHYCDQRDPTLAVCEPSCDNRNGFCHNQPSCPPRKCRCKEGYFRHQGKCIRGEKCPAEACSEPNTTWHNCPYTYPKTCRDIKEFKAEKRCTYPQCECKPGYVRDDFKKCVPESSCPDKFDCPLVGQIMQDCPCSFHCYELDKKCDTCAPRGCACAPGYSLNYFGTECVKNDNCINPEPPIVPPKPPTAADLEIWKTKGIAH